MTAPSTIPLPVPPKFLAKLAASYPTLYKTALTHPAIDNHAHPLLRAQTREKIPILGLVSEAEGDALEEAVYTVSARLAAKQLQRLYGISISGDEQMTWDLIKNYRKDMDYDDLCRLCFKASGIESVLVDDGLGMVPGGGSDLTESFTWIDRFTAPGATKRIVRVEFEAEELFRKIFSDIKEPEEMQRRGQDHLSHSVLNEFKKKLRSHLRHSALLHVVAFKSVVAYRTGLDVSVLPGDITEEAAAVTELWGMYRADKQLRIQHKPLNDLVVRIALQVAGEKKIPVQFHTGIGDHEVCLARSSPSYMQPLIEAYPDNKFIILHASYPYTRDAGYLTSVYQNVFLDFGEIFPFVSSSGQRDVIRQVVELAPTKKILWSSDGHWWPESYYLGIYQARLGLFEVLAEMVTRDEITEAQAAKIVEDALYYNAKRVYQLS